MLLGNWPEFPNIFLSLLIVDLFVASSTSKMAEKFKKLVKVLCLLITGMFCIISFTDLKRLK